MLSVKQWPLRSQCVDHNPEQQNYSYADIFPNLNEIKQLNFSLQFDLIDK